MAMAKKQHPLARRAWNLLRVALIWARKQGGLKRRLVGNLRALASLWESSTGGDHRTERSSSPCYASIRHGEREMSFDETPTFRVRPPRCFPFCARSPQVDFDGDDDGYGNGDRKWMRAELRDEIEEDGEVDVKAEEFIRRFHRQMQMQRQISLIQFNEMLRRGT